MPRRVGLPGASELFRSTSGELAREAEVARTPGEPDADGRDARELDRLVQKELGRHDPRPAEADDPEAVLRARPGRRRPTAAEGRSVEHTGRVRHDEKITVYVSSEELLALEHLRLELRAQHGLAVDRGRIVRAAIAAALATVDEHGADADVVRRLSQ